MNHTDSLPAWQPDYHAFPMATSPTGLRPGAGSILPAVEATTGVTPVSIGKAEPYPLEEAARAVGSLERLSR